MRTTRIILIGQLLAGVMLAPVLFHLVAGSAPPYHPARASVVMLGYLVLPLGAGLLAYRARSARQRLSDPTRGYPLAADGFASPDQVPRTVVRAVRLALVAVSAVSGLVLLTGLRHGLGLWADTVPMPGWPQTSATVTRVYSEWNDGSRTYIPVAEFRVHGRTVYFTAPDSGDAVEAGDHIRVIYEPGNPYLLHDLSAGPGTWEYPLYSSLIEGVVALIALVAGLTLTDQKRFQCAGDEVPKARRRGRGAGEPMGAADGADTGHLSGPRLFGETGYATFLANRVQGGRGYGGG